LRPHAHVWGVGAGGSARREEARHARARVRRCPYPNKIQRGGLCACVRVRLGDTQRAAPAHAHVLPRAAGPAGTRVSLVSVYEGSCARLRTRWSHVLCACVYREGCLHTTHRRVCIHTYKDSDASHAHCWLRVWMRTDSVRGSQSALPLYTPVHMYRNGGGERAVHTHRQ